MSEMQSENSVPDYDYFDLSDQIKLSHKAAKEIQGDARKRKRHMAPLLATGLVTLLTGISAKKDEPIVVGGLTDVIAVVEYGQAMRRTRAQDVVAIGAALYQQRLSTHSNRGIPVWAKQEMDEANPMLLSVIDNVMHKLDPPDPVVAIQEWLEPTPDQQQPGIVARALGRVGLR